MTHVFRMLVVLLVLATSSSLFAQSREAEQLEDRIVRTFGAGRYEQALAEIDQYLAQWPDSPHMLYNQACAYALLDRRDASGQSLLAAVDRGFRDFGHMQRDPDLANMRAHPTYRAILEAQNRVDRKSSQRQLQRWKNRFGEEGYTYETDEKRHLDFATSVDSTSHSQMKRMLQKQADEMSRNLFGSPPTYWCLIAVPSAEDAKKFFDHDSTAGMYIHGDRRLVSRDIGASMRHEFAHLMHFGHMERLGQKHAFWIQEGLASLYEDYTLDKDGDFTFRPNLRHNIARKQVERNVAISWNRLFELDGKSFMAGNARHYPQVRSIFEFLADLDVLGEWYEHYTNTFKRSPDGARAFEETFGLPMEKVEKRWRQWVVDRGTIDDRIDYGDASIGVAGVDAGDGVRIVEFKGLGARRAGLRRGDVIVAVDETPVRARGELILAIAKRKVGDWVRLKIRRNGDYTTLRVRLEPLNAVVN